MLHQKVQIRWRRNGALRTTAHFIAESRPAVQAVFLLRFAATSRLLVKPTLRCAEAGSGWLLVTVAIYVLNGVSDIAGDRVNGSTRPLASGALEVRPAVLGATAATVAGVTLCYCDTIGCGLLATVMALLGLGYSAGPTLKRHAVGAAVTIGLGAGLSYAAGWSARSDLTVPRIVFAGALSCWVAAASSTKDFSDVTGDRMSGRRTLAVILGLRRASWAAALISAIAVVVVVPVANWAQVGLPPVIVLGVGTAALAGACSTVIRASARSQLRIPYRTYMLTQYAVNSLMLVASAA